MRTAQGLAINGNHSLHGDADPSHPFEKARFKLLRIDEGKHSSKRVMGGDPIGQVQQFGEPGLLRLPTFFDLDPSLCPADHSTHRQNEDISQAMQRAFDPVEDLLFEQKSFPGLVGLFLPSCPLHLFRP
jgi:hypothetical protein